MRALSTIRGSHLAAATAAAVGVCALTGCASGAGSAQTRTVTVTASRAASSSSAPTRVPVAVIPSGRAGVPRGGSLDMKSLNQRDASAVADAVMQTFARSDTRLDTSPIDAKRRAAPLLSGALLKGVQAPLGGNGASDADWSQLVAHHGYIDVGGIKVGPPSGPDMTGDSPTQALRQVSITATPRGDGGWTGPAQQSTSIVALTRTGPSAPWRVIQVGPA